MTRVRLFASLREIAGASEVEATGATVEEVVRVLAERFGDRFEDIARAGSVVVDGERVTSDHPVGAEDQVALLPPVSGGSR